MIPEIAVLIAAYTIPRLILATMQYMATNPTKRASNVAVLITSVGVLVILGALVDVLMRGADVYQKLQGIPHTP